MSETIYIDISVMKLIFFFFDVLINQFPSIYEKNVLAKANLFMQNKCLCIISLF